MNHKVTKSIMAARRALANCGRLCAPFVFFVSSWLKSWRPSRLGFFTLGLLAISCAPEDQKSLQNNFASAQKQFLAAWKNVNDEARQLDTSSTKAQIDKALDDLHKQEIVASSESQKQVDSVKEQIERLHLAEKVQDLRADMESKLKDFDEIDKKAKEGIETSDKIKQTAYDDYLKAHSELALAQKDYDEAVKRAQAAWNAASAP